MNITWQTLPNIIGYKISSLATTSTEITHNYDASIQFVESVEPSPMPYVESRRLNKKQSTFKAPVAAATISSEATCSGLGRQL